MKMWNIRTGEVRTYKQLERRYLAALVSPLYLDDCIRQNDWVPLSEKDKYDIESDTYAF